MPESRPTSGLSSTESCPRAVVSVSEMARMVRLSRSRFHELVGIALGNLRPWSFPTLPCLIEAVRFE